MSFLSSYQERWHDFSEHYPWSYMGFLIVAMLVPTLYDLSNVYWVGKISLDALAIAEQYEFLSVTIEIVNETIPFGVLALVAYHYRDRDKVLSILKAGLLMHILFSCFLASVVILFTSQFVNAIGTPANIVQITKNYLVLRSLALPFDAVSVLVLVGIKSMQKGKEALVLVFISVVINMILDLFLISNLSFSLHLGINGIAIGYFFSKLFLMLFSSVYLLRILQVDLRTVFHTSWLSQIKPIFSIGSWTGLDSLVRNVGYIGQLMLLNLIGTNEYGGYELAMTVMWTLIIPMLALTEGTNVVIGNFYGQQNTKEMRNMLYVSLILSVGYMLLVGLFGVFFWNATSAFFNDNPAMIHFSDVTYVYLIVPYIVFAISNILRSTFIGTGKTYNIFILGAIANFGIILPYVALVRLGYAVASFESVMLLFVVVFLLDSLK